MTALVWCPFPDRASAEAVAGCLQEERLIACANLAEELTSLFVWQGEAGSATECGALFKTDEARVDELVARLVALHPYETPAVLGWPCPVASTETRVWIRSVVMPGDAA